MLNGKQLRIGRNILGLTCQNFADEMCCSKQTISYVELGKSINTIAHKFYNHLIREKN